MITLLKDGRYRLIDTKKQTRILYLDDKAYAWIDATGIGEILVATHTPHKTDSIISVGGYKLYRISEEPKLSDQLHLELEAGAGVWQGYLLPTGLPTAVKNRSRIIPTKETITADVLQDSVANKQAAARLTQTQLRSLGAKIGIDFDKINMGEFKQGLLVELEHGLVDSQTNVTSNNMLETAKIAWAHLKEMPDYYTRLKAMEAAAES